EDDHRTKYISLTEAGRLVATEAEQEIYTYLESLIEGKVEEEEIIQFIETFKKIKEILQLNV
ncbi:MAG TPA: MarR family transcriptional regulator, partial [Exiguobacterium sp.]|nr:MarR family transcriptional regulator [Exiguobacterium sp.]